MSLYIGREATQLTGTETYLAPETVHRQYCGGADNTRVEEEEKEEETEGKKKWIRLSSLSDPGWD